MISMLQKYVPILIFVFILGISGQTTDTSFVDQRDKKEYKIVKIGSQTWMAENMKYRPAGSQKIWCYGDDEKNCEKYGALYAWETAIEGCPQGWRIPSSQDWKALQASLETGNKTEGIAKQLMDATKFNALFGGFRVGDNGYRLLERHTIFWSSDVDTSFSEQAARFGRYFGQHFYQADPTTFKFEPSRGKPDIGRSLRCIQN